MTQKVSQLQYFFMYLKKKYHTLNSLMTEECMQTKKRAGCRKKEQEQTAAEKKPIIESRDWRSRGVKSCRSQLFISMPAKK